MKPPGCDDPRTLALVGYQLAQILAPIPSPDLVRIRTMAGGRFAIRFVCTAEFADPDGIRLPNGTLIRSIQFTSALDAANHVQQVSVRLKPVLEWVKVQ